MPWSKDGGGGGKGPWGQGPWGQGPGGPSGGNRGPTPPDLDELIRKGQDSLKNILPGGAGGRSTWIIFILAILALIAFNSVYQVQADERGVVLRLGSYTRTVSPGLHFAIWPVETMETVRVEAENQTAIGATANEGLMLAGDQKSGRYPFHCPVEDQESGRISIQRQATRRSSSRASPKVPCARSSAARPPRKSAPPAVSRPRTR